MCSLINILEKTDLVSTCSDMFVLSIFQGNESSKITSWITIDGSQFKISKKGESTLVLLEI